jgi:hypothetical protein
MPKTFTSVVFGALSVGLVLGFTACGGGGKSYSLESTSSCLTAVGGFDVSTSADDLDYIAQDASGGALTADINGDRVVVAFGGSSADGQRMEATYKMFAAGFGVPVSDILARHGNAVVSWDNTPAQNQATAVAECLK